MAYQDQSYQQSYGQQQPYAHQGFQPQQQYYGQQQGYSEQPNQQYGAYQQPPAQHQGGIQAQRTSETSDSGSYQSLTWTIKHRNTNSILSVNLPSGEVLKSKPGAMIHMSPTITLQGAIKFSFRKMFTGGQMAEASFAGPGTVALAPTLMGDIVTLPISQQSNNGRPWMVGKDAYLASTAGVMKDTKAQGLGKTFFSGEDMFVYVMSGQGMAWLTSYGAIETIELQAGEQHVVDNGHLVAWNCEYGIEKAGGSAMHSMKSGEGFVCRFTGPGTVYIQTRNLGDFAAWIRAQVPSN